MQKDFRPRVYMMRVFIETRSVCHILDIDVFIPVIDITNIDNCMSE